MKLKSYNILFLLFSFLSDKTNGAPFFVKYKLLLGTILIGLISSPARASKREIVGDSIPFRPIAAEISCYRIAISKSEKNDNDCIEVKGKVKDQYGEEIVGVSVKTKNISQIEVFTDFDGNFTLTANANDTLSFSFLGFETQEIPVSQIQDGKGEITLEQDDSILITCYIIVVSTNPYLDDIYRRSPKKIKKLAYDEVDTNPVFTAGDIKDFENWSQSNIQYSEQMKADKLKGQVILGFAVDKEGRLVNKKVITKLSKEADQEALRLLSLSEKWTPGRFDNKPIKTTMTVTINFDAQ